MEKEDYVSRIVAEWLKRRGFNWECRTFYDGNGKLRRVECDHAITRENLCHSDDVLAPTLQKAVKWLREVHGVDIIVFREKLPETRYWARIERHPYTLHQQEPVYMKHEDSCLAAVDYALTEILGKNG